MEHYLGHMGGVLVRIKHYSRYTWVLYYDKGEKFVGGKFFNPPHPEDGYAPLDCKDPRAKRVLEFLISIFYPRKLASVIVIVGGRARFNKRCKGRARNR